MKTHRIFDRTDTLDFGKYRSQTLEQVFLHDPDYVHEKLCSKKKFNITIDAFRHLQEIKPDFVFSEEALKSVVNQKKYSMKPGESEFKLFPSRDPFIQPLDDTGLDF